MADAKHWIRNNAICFLEKGEMPIKNIRIGLAKNFELCIFFFSIFCHYLYASYIGTHSLIQIVKFLRLLESIITASQEMLHA